MDDGIYITAKQQKDELKSVARQGLASPDDIEFQQDGNVIATVWQDTNPVVMLSSQLWGEKKKRSVIHVTCPQVVVDYNAHMGGVDLGD